jgi:hypothetical protein
MFGYGGLEYLSSLNVAAKLIKARTARGKKDHITGLSSIESVLDGFQQ